MSKKKSKKFAKKLANVIEDLLEFIIGCVVIFVIIWALNYFGITLGGIIPAIINMIKDFWYAFPILFLIILGWKIFD